MNGKAHVGPPALAGQWEFPGGKVEVGESAQGALRREIREELGIEIELGAEVVNPNGSQWPISTTMAMRTWLARSTTVAPKAGSSHSEVRWLAHDQLGTVHWVQVDALIVDLLIARSTLTVEMVEASSEA